MHPQHSQSAAVDALHTRLMARYGSAWAHLYLGVDPQTVKADWADQLRGLSGDQVGYALANLPERPPNAGAFRNLARSMPLPGSMPALPEPSTRESRERMAAAMAEGMRCAAEARKGYSERAWAIKRLRDRIARGGSTEAQREALRLMEAEDAGAERQLLGEFVPIPVHLLPPDMRAEAEREGRA